MSSAMSDKRPDQRFAMIALEMDGGDEVLAAPTPPAETNVLLASREGWVCPLCGNNAFEPGLDRRTVPDGVAALICLGCPSTPWYPHPDPTGRIISTKGYRCKACGLRRQVTATIPDINLHCTRCKKLALHVRDDGESGTTRPPRLPSKRRLTPEARRRFDETIARATSARERTGPSVITDGVNDIQIDARDPVLVNLTQTMMSIIGLEDFDAYADRKRRENLAPWRDQDRDERLDDLFERAGPPSERGTGRTTRGILELMARYYLATTRPTVWVLGGRPQIDVWLRGEVHRLRRTLGNVDPERVEVVPDGELLVGRGLKPPTGVMLYVDHTYYETNGMRSGGMGITYRYKPD